MMDSIQFSELSKPLASKELAQQFDDYLMPGCPLQWFRLHTCTSDEPDSSCLGVATV
jgi:hypothetical protein